MDKVIVKRCLSVLLCAALFWSSFTVSAFADSVIENIGGYLYDYLQTLVDSGIVVATKYFDTIDGIATEVFQLDKDNYEKFASAAASSPMPKSGQKVSTKHTTDHLLQLYCPDWGYSDWYCQPYINSDGHSFFCTSYFRLFYSDNKLCRELYTYSDSYSAADLVRSTDFGNYQFVYGEGFITSSYSFYYRLRSANDIASFNSYKSSIITNSYGELFQFVGVGSSPFDCENIIDYGYYISRTPFYTNSFDPDSIPDGGSVIVPRNASSFDDLSVRPLGYTPDYDNSGNVGNGGIKGDITVSGNVDVNISVPDININVNGGSASLPDIDVVENLPEAPQNFIDYLKTLFDFLPGQVLALIVAAIACAVFCRVWGR